MPRFRPFETEFQVGEIVLNDDAGGTSSYFQSCAYLSTRPRTIPCHKHIVNIAGNVVAAAVTRCDLLRGIVTTVVRTRHIDEVLSTWSTGIGRG